MNNSAIAEDVAPPDPWTDKLPRCIVYPQDASLGALLRDLVGNRILVAEDARSELPYAVVLNCLESVDTVRPARKDHPGRPLVAVVGRPDAVQALEALAEDVDGIVCLTDPATTWRDCLNVVLGGGRWFGGPGVEVSLEHKSATYAMSRGTDHPGDITARTRTFVRRSIPERFHR
jgi:hypothetical protein